MIVNCSKCHFYFDDTFRLTYCPHATFPANDGSNNFTRYEGAYLSKDPPPQVTLPKRFLSFDEFTERVGGWSVLLAMYLSLGGRIEGLPTNIQLFLARELEKAKVKQEEKTP